MIEGLQPYSDYKESAVPWLGSIPSTWRAERTKWVFRKRKELNVGRKCSNVLSLTLRGVVNNDPDSPEGLVPKDYATYQLFRKNDLVFKLIDLENLRTSRVGLVHEDGIMSSAYLRLIPQADCNVRFFYHQFFDLYTRAVFNALGAGVRSTLGAEDLGEIRILLPPADEQAAIVRFLDHANRKIDGFIRAKRKLIGLLNEQKQAIIHRAVTRGLDPNVKLKDSGIPWLGDIPEHWEVWPLKRIGWFKSGAGFPVTDQGRKDLEVPFLKVSDMNLPGNERWIETSNNTVSCEDAKNLGAFVFPEGTIIFPKVGGAMLTNKRRLVRRPSCIDNNVMGCVVRRGHGEFVFLLLQQLDLGRLSKPGPVPAIGEGEVREIKVVFPPIKEQRAIVPAVDRECSPLNTAIARTEREIALMQEYRTRLTADVVTGKLDVRAAAAKLPDIGKEVEVELDKTDETEELGEET